MKKGSHHSEETLAQMSGSHKDNNPSEETLVKLRKPKSEDHKRKISVARLGMKFSVETRRKMREHHCGGRVAGFTVSEETKAKHRKPRSEETKAKLRGRHHSEETRAKMSKSHKGMKYSKERNKKISAAETGEKHWNWHGGSTCNYTPDWSSISKREIKLAEGICCWPGCVRTATGSHHINGNPQDNRRANLLPLCDTHHNPCSGRKRDLLQLECMEIQRLRGILKC
jgi:hypothetical protein